ncbi:MULTISPECIES: DUF6021 family protein [Pseudomonas]|jgi:hypothetical protein|uniref:Uncharacterized protein n=1 Tax=Pseudomonas fluorescens TaxID=294 RepID=A0A5E7I383_PSEFL|nr:MULTISPECIES: DUF6021 family protein [Pseudomonas]KPG97768.1 hypothetical protein AK821_08290 [Pseudomonas sp. RIT-PI-r]MCF5701247.1 hypothetical protein [Pseudomonas syringae]MCP1489087.1 hypothetical protein [Pseudomonas fluorescens]PRB49925.1 hypothetical protein CQ025_10005 [Pseudomonas sp. MYb3]PRC36563.1 hypothetical protein CQ009_03105 [Pseudomonas sp. MYb2]
MADSPSPKGPHSTEHSSGHDLGFDPDSPDLDDPQVDPVGPAKAPKDVKPGEDDKQPAKPYDPLANLKP